jgi:Tfp pilus assembly protein PilO
MTKMTEQTKIALVVVAMIVLAGAFWLFLLSPKRDKAGELSTQITALTGEVSAARQQAVTALAAKRNFASDYHQLVELGAAVPGEAATPSLLVQLNGLSDRARTSFQSIALGSASGGEAATAETTTESSSTSTELLPLGASAGPSGFAAMPYTLAFEGGFFDITKFIHSLDSLVKTKADGKVDVHGRLVTIDSFSLTPVGSEGKGGATGQLAANFAVSTYVTPPGQGLTAGATAAGPAETTPDVVP